MAAFGPISGSMLTSTADRDRAVDVLRTGFVEGRLTQEEFTERVAQVHLSRTYDQLTELTSDLPADSAQASHAPASHAPARYPPAGSPERHQPRWQGVSAAGLTLTSVIIFALAALVTALALILDAPTVQMSPATVVRPAPQATPHANLMPYTRHYPRSSR